MLDPGRWENFDEFYNEIHIVNLFEVYLVAKKILMITRKRK